MILVGLLVLQLLELVVILVHLVMDLQHLVVLEITGQVVAVAVPVVPVVMQDRLVLEPGQEEDMVVLVTLVIMHMDLPIL